MHVDHLTPRIWEGKDEPINLALSCQPCNTRKGTADLEAYAWMLERYGKIPSADALVKRVRAQAALPIDWTAAARLLKMKK